jgi:plasmid maintenance system killer protein
MSLANRQVFEPRWTQQVIDEMRRNSPPGVFEANIDRRINMMNAAFPEAMTDAPPQELQDQMQADPKDKHMLAGAVRSEADCLSPTTSKTSTHRRPVRARCEWRV